MALVLYQLGELGIINAVFTREEAITCVREAAGATAVLGLFYEHSSSSPAAAAGLVAEKSPAAMRARRVGGSAAVSRRVSGSDLSLKFRDFCEFWVRFSYKSGYRTDPSFSAPLGDILLQTLDELFYKVGVTWHA